MSRSGYNDDDCECDTAAALALGRWRAQVASAIRGQRGQTFLQEMVAALDAMSEKRLIANDLVRDGQVCAIGALGAARGIDMSRLDPDDYDAVADAFGIAHQLAQEIVWANDEAGSYKETPEARWQRMREWVANRIKQPSV